MVQFKLHDAFDTLYFIVKSQPVLALKERNLLFFEIMSNHKLYYCSSFNSLVMSCKAYHIVLKYLHCGPKMNKCFKQVKEQSKC